MPLVLGVDSSTQATKVEIRDADDGVLVASGRAPHAVRGRPPRSEQDPTVWWEALVAATAEALAHAPTGTASEVRAVSIAGQQHGLVVVDGDGAVLRPAVLWNDVRSASQADRLVDRLGADAWARRCGSVPAASFTVTTLAWLVDTEPYTAARTASVLLPHDWLTWRLTGARVTDRGDASGTGWWSPTSGTYDAGLLATTGAPFGIEVLPRVLAPGEAAGPLTSRAAVQLGLQPPAGLDVVVGPGTGDNMAAALGLALEGGDVVISLGTSGTVYAMSRTPTADATGAVAGFADASGHFLPLVCTLNATQVTDAVGRLLGVDHATFDELALSASTGSDGLTLLPYLSGERTPNRPAATGVLSGLRPDVSRQAMARAAVEGVVCGLLDGVDALAAAGVPTTDGRLLLIGGGARSAAARHVVADLTGRLVTVPAGDEHVATGACVQAATVLAGVSDPMELARSWAARGPGAAAAVTPDDSATARAAAAAARAAYAHIRDATP